MLSSKAWNALLKTVEEPPPHAKFIFATTELRKVPITVLSRCQRFELRRVEPEELAAHLAGICAKEGVAVAPEALALIARAAEGSVRDALSLLDQAIATAEGPVDGALVQSMLGLGDRLQLLDLLDAVMRGDAERGARALRPALRPGRRPGRRGAGPARGRPLAVAAEGGGRGHLQPGHRCRRGRARGGDGQGAVAAGAGARLADAAARHRRDPRSHRTPQAPPRCCCCASPASATCPPPAELARLLRDGAEPELAAPVPASSDDCARLAAPSRPWRCRRRRDQRRRSCRPTTRPPSHRASPTSWHGCATAARLRSRPGCRRARI